MRREGKSVPKSFSLFPCDYNLLLIPWKETSATHAEGAMNYERGKWKKQMGEKFTYSAFVCDVINE